MTTTLKQKVMKQLSLVIDPELGVDIVGLGLIYDVEISERHCQINMTLTTPGCPLSGLLDIDIQEKVLALKEIDSVEVKLVWYPVWSVDRMSTAAKMALGIKDGDFL